MEPLKHRGHGICRTDSLPEPNPGAKKRRGSKLTEEQRREKRKAANRKSAAASRMRRINYFQELEAKVEELRNPNAALMMEKDALRAQV